MQPSKVTRRALLGSGAAIATAAAANTSAAAPALFADVVVVGSGACGMTAAIAAREAGASVILLEAEPDIGGHAICSGGNVALGGGTSVQKRHGIEDSPDKLFADLTDWSVISPNGFPDYRYNDREIIRAFADHSAEVFEWLVRQGVVFSEGPPDDLGGVSVGNSVPREMHASAGAWPLVQTGQPAPAGSHTAWSTGNGLMRPLEAAARRAGVRILLESYMTGVTRQGPRSGKVTGVTFRQKGASLTVQARKGVVLATGGSTSNVNFRRMFDPRLTEEYCGAAGQPWSSQDASGELAGMAIGASLWGLYNQTGEFGSNITKPGHIGCQYGYIHLQWEPGSRVFPKARARGLKVADWQNLVLVNMVGRRFYDETAGAYGANSAGKIKPYVQGDFRNVRPDLFQPRNWVNAAMAGIGDGHNGGGPIWAIFDADGADREGWDPRPPNVDMQQGFFFQADTLGELARRIVMKHQRVAMPSAALEETIARYNGFVSSGRDDDFGRPKPRYKIAKPPFYAAWSSPVLHDTRAGLRIDANCRVIDMDGAVIPGLYCGGESAGGFSQHGLARATCQGYIAGRHVAR